MYVSGQVHLTIAGHVCVRVCMCMSCKPPETYILLVPIMQIQQTKNAQKYIQTYMHVYKTPQFFDVMIKRTKNCYVKKDEKLSVLVLSYGRALYRYGRALYRYGRALYRAHAAASVCAKSHARILYRAHIASSLCAKCDMR